jgi:2-methylisocitrate lyase-like PEP mutase family enzyme
MKKEAFMITQIKQTDLFKALHIKGDPLILFNIWDAGSAKVIEETGAKAIATGSWSVAAAHGYDDGEKLSLDLVLENLKRIIAKVNLPVTLDLEGAYSKSPIEIQAIIKQVIEAGAVGINFEDQIIGGQDLYSIEYQCLRIKAIREVADNLLPSFFINARTDIFLKTEAVNHNDQQLEEAIERSIAYAQAGANGFFVPGLQNSQHIKKLCASSRLLINIMTSLKTFTVKQLAELGVARISYGPVPYCLAMNALKEAGRIALSI